MKKIANIDSNIASRTVQNDVSRLFTLTFILDVKLLAFVLICEYLGNVDKCAVRLQQTVVV